jgi:hypothetical protein
VTVTEDNIAVYRRELVARYEVGTVAVKLAAIRRLYEAAVWRGLRQDNPAAGLKAPVGAACRPIGRREVRQKSAPRGTPLPQGPHPSERRLPDGQLHLKAFTFPGGGAGGGGPSDCLFRCFEGPDCWLG